LKFGWAPQDARGLLPNDLKTEIVWSMNLRAARHMDGLRTPKSAHPDMQVTAREIHRILYENLPLLFQDIQNQIDTAAWIERLAKD
jgi:thymidylate synthase ThyX